MAISDFTLVTLVTFLLGGGGSSDLLDYVPADAYWQAKHIVVTSDVLLNELKAAPAAGNIDDLIAQLGAADSDSREQAAGKIRAMGTAAVPALQKEASSEDVEIALRAKSLLSEINAAVKPAAVRKLMAIRTLGEKGERRALDMLRGLIDSKEPFVAAYAQRAVAQIEGKTTDHSVRTDALRPDIWLLPANIAAVGQFAPGPGLAQRFDQAVEPMHITPAQKKDRVQTLTEYALEMADNIGNVRIDGVTVGLSDDFGPSSGFLVAVVRGQFDRIAVAERVRQEGSPSGKIDGVDVFQLEDGAALFFPSDDLAVYMMGPDPQKLPTREMIAATRAGKGGVEKAAGISDLIKSAETDQPLWGVVRVTEAYRQFPIASGFDRAILVGRQQGPTFQFALSAAGTDPKRVDISVHELQRHHKEALDWMRNIAPVMPPLQRVMRFLESIKPSVEGTKLSATGTFEGPVTRLIVFTNFPYATAQPVEEGKPLPPPKKPQEAPLNPDAR